MNRNTSDTILVGAVLTALTALMFAVLVGGGWAVGYYKCTTKATAMSMPHTWGPIQGCMVKTSSGRVVPLGSIRDVTP